MTSTSKRLWKNEYFQTAVMIGLIVIVVFGFWYGSRVILNTDYPMLAVASGSMCHVHAPYEPCDGWTHPFATTLHTGDLIIVQGINASDINAGPDPKGDIVVYRRASDGELIVHRATNKTIQADGTVTIITKGDANGNSYDPPITGDQVIGRVILRMPWVGHLALIMRNSTGVYLIIALIIILVVIELLIPMLRDKKAENVQRQHGQAEDTTNSDTIPNTTS